MSNATYTCPCCGYKTLVADANSSYGICPVCFWEDDPVQRDNPYYEGGANIVSLVQAQKNFIQFDACDKTMIKNVRRPTMDEKRDEDWKPIT